MFTFAEGHDFCIKHGKGTYQVSRGGLELATFSYSERSQVNFECSDDPAAAAASEESLAFA